MNLRVRKLIKVTPRPRTSRAIRGIGGAADGQEAGISRSSIFRRNCAVCEELDV